VIDHVEEEWLTVDQHFTAESLVEEPIRTEMSACRLETKS
jgi:hypothetical protein